MKRIKFLVVTIIGIIFFTGCAIKIDTNMKISKDGQINFGLIQAFDRELLTNLMNMGGSETTYTVDELKQFLKQSLEESEDGESSDLDVYKQKGFTITEYIEEQFLGYKFSTTIDNIDNVSVETETIFDFSDLSKITGSMQEQKLFQKNDEQYVAHFIFNPSSSSALGTENNESDGNEDSTDEQMNQYLNMIEQIYTFTLTLPKEPVSHNATTISEDGKTLTWNLAKDAKTDINFIFTLKDTSNLANDSDSSLWLYIAIGLGVVVLATVIVVLLTRKKGNVNESNNQPFTPIQENNNLNDNLFNNAMNLDQNTLDKNINGVIESNELINSNIVASEETSVEPDIKSNDNIITKPMNKFCTNCGSKIIENNNFCINCGNKIER